MPEITVSLDGKDHRIMDGEHTACGLVVPHGTDWVDTLTDPCSTCFPKSSKKALASEPDAEPAEA